MAEENNSEKAFGIEIDLYPGGKIGFVIVWLTVAIGVVTEALVIAVYFGWYSPR